MARARSADRQAQIVAGLQTVMADRGYDRASVQAIAAAAGLSPGLVHYHFATKEAILVALVEALCAQLAVRLAAARGGPGRWDRVDGVLAALLAVDQGDPEALACWAQVAAEAQRVPAVAAAYRGALEQVQAALAEGLARAGVADPPRAAAGLAAAVEGALHVGVVAPGLLPAGAAAPLLGRMARGLAAGAS